MLYVGDKSDMPYNHYSLFYRPFYKTGTVDDFHFPFHRKNYNPLPLLSPLCPTLPPAHALNPVYI